MGRRLRESCLPTPSGRGCELTQPRSGQGLCLRLFLTASALNSQGCGKTCAPQLITRRADTFIIGIHTRMQLKNQHFLKDFLLDPPVPETWPNKLRRRSARKQLPTVLARSQLSPRAAAADRSFRPSIHPAPGTGSQSQRCFLRHSRGTTGGEVGREVGLP